VALSFLRHALALEEAMLAVTSCSFIRF